jgi:hypothetical protein
MTPAQAEIVRRSHFRLMARAGQLVDVFITRLRLLDPELAGLDVREGDDSGFPLVQWLGAVVALSKTPPVLQRSVQGMVRRFGGERVTPARVGHIARALLASVRTHLGRHWDAETAADRQHASGLSRARRREAAGQAAPA